MKKNNIYTYNKEYIDLSILFNQIWKKKKLILQISIIFTIVSLLISTLLISPKYKSETKVFTVNQHNKSEITNLDLFMGNYFLLDYREIILSDEVLEYVSKEVDLPKSEIVSKISVNSPKDNRVLTIKVIDSNPERAAKIANKARSESVEKFKKTTKINDISVIEEAIVPSEPFSPNILRNSILGFATGFLLTIIFVLIKELLGDIIKYPEDIEDNLELPLLGTIPKIYKEIRK